MSTQVLNLPLSRGAYTAIEEGERIVSLPNTHHTIKRLYQSDGLLTPKPYKRVNIRLGASGKPTQYTLERIRWAKDSEGELIHQLTLGREINPMEDKDWARWMFMVLQSQAMKQLACVKSTAAYERIEGMKKLCRKAEEIYNAVQRTLQYAPNNLLEHIEQERKQLWAYLSDELDSIFRETRRLLDPVNEGESSAHLKCEAWRLELYCLMLVRLFEHCGKPKDLVDPVNDGVQGMYRIAVNFSEGQALNPKLMDSMVARAFAKLLDYRQYSTVI